MGGTGRAARVRVSTVSDALVNLPGAGGEGLLPRTQLRAVRVPLSRLGAGNLDHVSVKEAVLPFNRFPDADTVLGPEMRKQAIHYQVDTFASVYLHNDGGGAFSASALPNLAQIAPIRRNLGIHFASTPTWLIR